MHSDETDKEEYASHYPYTFVHQEILNVSCNFDHKFVNMIVEFSYNQVPSQSSKLVVPLPFEITEENADRFYKTYFSTEDNADMFYQPYMSVWAEMINQNPEKPI